MLDVLWKPSSCRRVQTFGFKVTIFIFFSKINSLYQKIENYSTSEFLWKQNFNFYAFTNKYEFRNAFGTNKILILEEPYIVFFFPISKNIKNWNNGFLYRILR